MKFYQNYSLYKSAQSLVCKILDLQNVPFWSTADRSMVHWSAWFGLQIIPNRITVYLDYRILQIYTKQNKAETP